MHTNSVSSGVDRAVLPGDPGSRALWSRTVNTMRRAVVIRPMTSSARMRARNSAVIAPLVIVAAVAAVGALLTPTREFPVVAVLLGPLAAAVVLPWRPTALLAAIAATIGIVL